MGTYGECESTTGCISSTDVVDDDENANKLPTVFDFGALRVLEWTTGLVDFEELAAAVVTFRFEPSPTNVDFIVAAKLLLL